MCVQSANADHRRFRFPDFRQNPNWRTQRMGERGERRWCWWRSVAVVQLGLAAMVLMPFRSRCDGSDAIQSLEALLASLSHKVGCDLLTEIKDLATAKGFGLRCFTFVCGSLIRCYLFASYAHCNFLRRILSAMEEVALFAPCVCGGFKVLSATGAGARIDPTKNPHG